jgi:hypothetical protein
MQEHASPVATRATRASGLESDLDGGRMGACGAVAVQPRSSANRQGYVGQSRVLRKNISTAEGEIPLL